MEVPSHYILYLLYYYAIWRIEAEQMGATHLLLYPFLAIARFVYSHLSPSFFSNKSNNQFEPFFFIRMDYGVILSYSESSINVLYLNFFSSHRNRLLVFLKYLISTTCISILERLTFRLTFYYSADTYPAL